MSGTRKPAPLSSTPPTPTRAPDPILVPPPAAPAPVLVPSTPSSSSPSVDPPPLLTASQKIILDSPVSSTDSEDTTVSLSMPPESEGHGQRVFELSGLQTKYRGQKLDDGKTIGGVGRLTDDLINSLQNYYGTAIRCNRGNLQGMVRAVQASLLHCNSTDESQCHHLCPEGTNSWCKWQKAKARGKVFQHKRKPIPECIVHLIKPTQDWVILRCFRSASTGTRKT